MQDRVADLERLIFQSDQADSGDDEISSHFFRTNFFPTEHRGDSGQVLLLDYCHLAFRLSAGRVVVSDEARSNLNASFRDNFDDSPTSRTQTDPLDSTVLEMFGLQVSDDFQR